MDLTNAEWRKSSFSGSNGGGCVEVARNLPGVVAVRDSKDRQGPALVFAPDEWRAFLDGVRATEFDLR
ncbi:MAG: DUF397 domain-containing protein [Streptosporangiaceae bacterium]